MIALVAIILVLIWSTAKARQDVQIRDERMVALAQDRSRDTSAITALQARLKVLEQELKSLRSAEKSAGAPTPTGPKMIQSVDITRYVEADPGYAAYRDRVNHDGLLMRYGDLHRLNLPPEKLERLQRLLIDQMNGPEDARRAALELGFAEGSPEMNRAIGDTIRQLDKELRDLMGKTGMADLQAAQLQTNNLTEVQGRIGVSMILSGAPLSGEQTRAIADLLAEDQGASRTSSRTPDQENALLAKIAQVLSPQQMEIYEHDRDTRKMQNALHQRALEAAKKDLGHDINSWSISGP